MTAILIVTLLIEAALYAMRPRKFNRRGTRRLP